MPILAFNLSKLKSTRDTYSLSKLVALAMKLSGMDLSLLLLSRLQAHREK